MDANPSDEEPGNVMELPPEDAALEGTPPEEGAPDETTTPDGAGAAEDVPDEDSDEAEESDKAPPGPGAALSDDELCERVCALVFASPEPLSVGRLVKLLERPEAARVKRALEAVTERLQKSDLPLQLRSVAGGHTFFTTPEVAETVARLSKDRKVERISAAALETLSVIAYRQPVTKAEIEAIRGVQAGPILRSLVDRGLARVVGRADVPGHPLQYGTTRTFLDRFGLMNLKELPRDSELARD